MHATQAQLLGVMPLKLKSAFDPNPQPGAPVSQPAEQADVAVTLSTQLQQDICAAANASELTVVAGDTISWTCHAQQAHLVIPEMQLSATQKRALWQQIWSGQS
ncbi:hypothetical protein CWC22_016595 [Pseudoalteromonas rubra]|uniref:Uncharacterized protein n=1 Tax=Pseudoalteromonas rubra TaxID=43658 RepID=A0A5S3UVG2_9GAMM|nr:hypothetical protein [Pseudoalteromonas rubra]QPB84516.1 hypothetical protein CWC22_016595 [Pseudoalteromonas rubra]